MSDATGALEYRLQIIQDAVKRLSPTTKDRIPRYQEGTERCPHELLAWNPESVDHKPNPAHKRGDSDEQFDQRRAIGLLVWKGSVFIVAPPRNARDS